ncbi:nucleotidyltransferase [Salinibacillus xinjiangensis]|uniref:tRNA(Met) cytidine acetate ligase n=1 Tax=Salinibacillus xinjiangensis TaxID=1229268 RepID=A0A6G1X3Q1_9BACI|nr:nucleotidyltransferase [Salinibacillus xinjiangensis]MRG85510.1 nucleotidyltransferase [Salinibacillus xinjiangensis]
MKACGLIVEYNPFHNGHVYHLQSSKKKTNADVLVAVMSGDFLQRGEPAIIDKWHRAEAALQSGVDVVLELPYVYAVQHADLFAKGAVLTLNSLNVDCVCFGSEKGKVKPFIDAYHHLKGKESTFNEELHLHLKAGLSFPEASKKAYEAVQLTTDGLDLSKPNNILGFSYVKAIYEAGSMMKPETIQRTKSGYHDPEIKDTIASATSIRNEINTNIRLSDKVINAIPKVTSDALNNYKNKSGLFHQWEHYFSFVQHTVLTKRIDELQQIQGVEEGLEFRLKKTAKKAKSFYHWMELLKTKRYTWTRLQRMFVHILTNTTKHELQAIHTLQTLPYVRLLGFSSRGREYINRQKKQLETPLISQIQSLQHPFLDIEERASDTYYLAIPHHKRSEIAKQEIGPPILVN